MQRPWRYLTTSFAKTDGGVSPLVIMVVSIIVSSALGSAILLRRHHTIIQWRYDALQSHYMAISGFVLAHRLVESGVVMPVLAVPEKSSEDFLYENYRLGYPIPLPNGTVYIIESATGYRYSIAIMNNADSRTVLKRYIQS